MSENDEAQPPLFEYRLSWGDILDRQDLRIALDAIGLSNQPGQTNSNNFKPVENLTYDQTSWLLETLGMLPLDHEDESERYQISQEKKQHLDSVGAEVISKINLNALFSYLLFGADSRKPKLTLFGQQIQNLSSKTPEDLLAEIDRTKFYFGSSAQTLDAHSKTLKRLQFMLNLLENHQEFSNKSRIQILESIMQGFKSQLEPGSR